MESRRPSPNSYYGTILENISKSAILNQYKAIENISSNYPTRLIWQHFWILISSKRLLFIKSFSRKTITFPHELEKDILLLQIVGEKIYSHTDVEHIRHKLEPNKSELLKLAECSGRVLDEKPEKVTEAIMLFLQGVGFCKFLKQELKILGLVPSLNVHEIVRKNSEEST